MQGSQSAIAKLDKVRAEKLRALETELRCKIVPLDPGPQLAELSQEQYARLQVLEREVGVSLVAYEAAFQIRLANPSRQQLELLEEVERKLGFVLVAYELAGEDVRTRKSLTEERARVAKLSDKQSERLQEVEKEVGLTLMAYR